MGDMLTEILSVRQATACIEKSLSIIRKEDGKYWTSLRGRELSKKHLNCYLRMLGSKAYACLIQTQIRSVCTNFAQGTGDKAEI